MNKIFKILISVFLVISFVDVSAETGTDDTKKTKPLFFVLGCPESEAAAKEYGITLTHTGWYEVDISGGEHDGSVCVPLEEDKLACSFGCVEDVLTGENVLEGNQAVLEALEATYPIPGNNYCKMVCLPNYEFKDPNFIPLVEQGTKFTWTIGGSRGALDKTLSDNPPKPEIVRLKNESTCAIVFDETKWNSAYKSAVTTINQYNTVRRKKVLCGFGYNYDSSTENCVDIYNSNNKYPARCDTHYHKSGNSCEIDESYLKDLEKKAVKAAAQIDVLYNNALDCHNYNKQPNIKACGTATVEYDDELYGGENYKVELEEHRNGIITKRNWTTKKTLDYLMADKYNCKGDRCDSDSRGIYNLNLYRDGEFSTETVWKLPEYFYRYVLNNGISIYDYRQSPEWNNAKGINSFYGSYQNYFNIGFPNFPVNFNSKLGLHEDGIKVNFKFCSDSGIYSDKEVYGSCPYEVTDTPVPPPDPDPIPPDPDPIPPDGNPGDDPGDTPGGGSVLSTGFNVIYRVIELDNPFPSIDGTGRKPGFNWSVKSNYVTDYITNNRGVQTEEVYNEEPMYTITLTPSLIQEIRSYNNSNDMNDFELVCKEGNECRSLYLRELINQGHVSGCGSEKDFGACGG